MLLIGLIVIYTYYLKVTGANGFLTDHFCGYVTAVIEEDYSDHSFMCMVKIADEHTQSDRIIKITTETIGYQRVAIGDYIEVESVYHPSSYEMAENPLEYEYPASHLNKVVTNK